jgi:hypothetical protein
MVIDRDMDSDPEDVAVSERETLPVLVTVSEADIIREVVSVTDRLDVRVMEEVLVHDCVELSVLENV